jgi:hypothetical protein
VGGGGLRVVVEWRRQLSLASHGETRCGKAPAVANQDPKEAQEKGGGRGGEEEGEEGTGDGEREPASQTARPAGPRRWSGLIRSVTHSPHFRRPRRRSKSRDLISRPGLWERGSTVHKGPPN